MIMTFYPQDIARTLFNADHIMVYPYNMEGKKYEDNFTRVRVVAIEKNGIDVFLYFAMTDQGIKDFDKYLMDFKGVFYSLNSRQDNDKTEFRCTVIATLVT